MSKKAHHTNSPSSFQGREWRNEMAMISLFRIETFDGLVWTGGGFSHDELDAETFATDDEALEEISALGLQDVFAEKFERYSAVPARTVYAATEERRSAA